MDTVQVPYWLQSEAEVELILIERKECLDFLIEWKEQQIIKQGHILKNIIYLELIRRGYRVYVGKAGSAEVDFVAQDCDGNLEYYRVALTVREETALARRCKSAGPVQKIMVILMCLSRKYSRVQSQ